MGWSACSWNLYSRAAKSYPVPLQEYESVDVGKRTYKKERGGAELIVADAPTRPKFGGKGLKDNTTYQYEDSDDEDEEEMEHQRREGGSPPSLHSLLEIPASIPHPSRSDDQATRPLAQEQQRQILFALLKEACSILDWPGHSSLHGHVQQQEIVPADGQRPVAKMIPVKA